jgi:uncharacterized cupin superfamily protein
MKRANIFSDEFEYDDSDPDGYHAGVARVGALAGGEALNVKLYEIRPHQSLCPYHYEYEEEWLVVLDGELVVRIPGGEDGLERGAIVCFPPGPAGAHKVSNRSDQTARIMMFSSAREPAVAVYPDSDKLGVVTGNPDDRVLVRRADGNAGYYDGET